MSANIVGILYAFGAALTWAISGILMKVLVEKNDPFFLNGIQSIFASALMLTIVTGNGLGRQLLEMRCTTFLFLLGIALFSIVLGKSLFYKSQKSIPVSIAYPMASSYPIFAVFFAWILNHDPFTWLNALAAVIVIGGIGLLSRSQDPARISVSTLATSKWNQGIGLALISGAIWGVGSIATKVGTTLADPIIVSATMAWTATISLMGWQILRNKLRLRLSQLNGVDLGSRRARWGNRHRQPLVYLRHSLDRRPACRNRHSLFPNLFRGAGWNFPEGAHFLVVRPGDPDYHHRHDDCQLLDQTTNELVIGQRKVEGKSNEITAIPELLNLLNVHDCIVTIDAIGTQKGIARQIRAQKAVLCACGKGQSRRIA